MDTQISGAPKMVGRVKITKPDGTVTEHEVELAMAGQHPSILRRISELFKKDN